MAAKGGAAMEDTPKSMREIVQKKFVDEVIGIAGMPFIFQFYFYIWLL